MANSSLNRFLIIALLSALLLSAGWSIAMNRELSAGGSSSGGIHDAIHSSSGTVISVDLNNRIVTLDPDDSSRARYRNNIGPIRFYFPQTIPSERLIDLCSLATGEHVVVEHFSACDKETGALVAQAIYRKTPS